MVECSLEALTATIHIQRLGQVPSPLRVVLLLHVEDALVDNIIDRVLGVQAHLARGDRERFHALDRSRLDAAVERPAQGQRDDQHPRDNLTHVSILPTSGASRACG